MEVKEGLMEVRGPSPGIVMLFLIQFPEVRMDSQVIGLCET